MRVLVTGGAGFIGSFLADRLLARGDEVRILDALDPQVHPDGPPTYLPSRAELILGDVRDRSRCTDALAHVDAVVHAAAVVGVAQSLYRVEHYVDVNVRGTATLLGCLTQQRAAVGKLVVLGSMTAYGEGCYRRRADGHAVRVPVRSEEDVRRHGWEPVAPVDAEPLEPVPVPEDAAPLASNVYALTKRFQEELALGVGAAHGLPVVSLRLFNVYGPRQSLRNPYTGVLAIFLSRLLAGERPVVYEDGAQTRDFVSVHDVVEAILRVLDSPVADGQVVNIGTGMARPIGDAARVLARLVGRPDLAPEITGRFRCGDVRHCTAHIGRARRLLGFAPQVDWEAGLAELVTWARGAPAADRFRQAELELREHGLLSGPLGADPKDRA